jgi:hypothetical protein
MNVELAEDIILILGEERINKVYGLIKGNPVSFAMLQKVLLWQKIKIQLDVANFKSVALVAKVCMVTERMVYRVIQKL